MNRLQASVLGVAVLNLAVMLLFPPYDSIALGRGGAQTFDAFYFAFDRHVDKLLNADLLLLELYWVIINASIAWLLLRPHPGAEREPIMSRRAAVVLFAIANLALVLLFPPFENYPSTLRFASTHFDGFYFVFGDKWQRRLYIPLLYMEILWILVNVGLIWLILRGDERPAPGPQPD